MRFTCSNCQNELNIPDDKLPATPRFKIKCPHCHERVILEKNREALGPMAPDLSGEHEEPEDSAYAEDMHSSESRLEPEIFPPGARIIFLALESQRWLEEARNFFQEMGYYESRAKDVTEAIMKLRLNDYHVLLLEDTPKYQPLLTEIGSWPGIKRREINVVLIGEHAQSLDPQIAFRKGINTYINAHELERGHDLFGLALKGYDEYYRYLQIAKGDEV